MSSIETKIQRERPLAEFSTFQIGGPARYFLEIESEEEAVEAMRYLSAQQLPYFVLGKGSNLLFDDRGFDGMILYNRILGCQLEDGAVVAGSGYSFALLGSQTARAGWAGLEFAAGIPGSVGGAVFMNAGAMGSDVSQVLEWARVVSAEGKLTQLCNEQMGFSYRTSFLQSSLQKGMVVGARFLLKPDKEASSRQRQMVLKRTSSQPYNLPSAGCIFRNTGRGAAGMWIEKAGLKGKRVGGAEVSDRHANFIVNQGGATAADVLQLMQEVQQRVEEISGEKLEREVLVVPYGS